jgi:hypothetical protein
MSDADAVLIYAAENATQRGESSTAGIGTIAAATWLLAKALMKGDVRELSQTCTLKAAETLRGQIASDKGLGRNVVFEFLKDTPGIREQSVRDFFSTIKSCGEYARIIDEVKCEIDEELKEELRKAKEAERAAVACSPPQSSLSAATRSKHLTGFRRDRREAVFLFVREPK